MSFEVLPQMILHYAEQRPDCSAFRCMGKTLTYQELGQKTNQLAGLLHELGVKKGDRVGILLNRSIETAIAIHGILLAGAVYVPMNPKAPIARNKFVIEDCEIKVIVTNPSQKRTINALREASRGINHILGLKSTQQSDVFSWSAIYERPIQEISIASIRPDDLAYILFTSGSTGQPKGIMHTHSSGMAYARLTAQTYSLNAEDVIANHAPIFFDISTLGYFTAPYVGACTVILSDAHTILPNSLCQLMVNEKITIWYSVPLALIQLLESDLTESLKQTSLRWVFYAGEAFPPKHLRQLMGLMPGVMVSNIYGPTELNQCTYFNLSSPPQSNSPIPIGQVWAETFALILDENEQEVPVNVQGELLVHSSTMMKGYWRKLTLSQQSFYTHDTGNGRALVYYRTGDLVTLDEDGIMHFNGRKDHQIKIRGYRVELGEIESFLLAHHAVKETIVLSNQRGDEQTLEAFLLTNDKVNEEELILHLKKDLPPYAIPHYFHFVDEFPRTGTGKVNRGKIKEAFLKTTY